MMASGSVLLAQSNQDSHNEATATTTPPPPPPPQHTDEVPEYARLYSELVVTPFHHAISMGNVVDMEDEWAWVAPSWATPVVRPCCPDLVVDPEDIKVLEFKGGDEALCGLSGVLVASSLRRTNSGGSFFGVDILIDDPSWVSLCRFSFQVWFDIPCYLEEVVDELGLLKNNQRIAQFRTGVSAPDCNPLDELPIIDIKGNSLKAAELSVAGALEVNVYFRICFCKYGVARGGVNLLLAGVGLREELPRPG
ncbi:hypothetical protein K440DRAFT_665373 [Wilcoxina mikolae CBS 423.85]|nr:hypothetical protein K440DRAFT_665373 [Wilcoxina mikolae CBS 423.85]